MTYAVRNATTATTTSMTAVAPNSEKGYGQTYRDTDGPTSRATQRTFYDWFRIVRLLCLFLAVWLRAEQREGEKETVGSTSDMHTQ